MSSKKQSISPSKQSHQHQHKYKTELCKSWSETGQCRYGTNCQFAHIPVDPLPHQSRPPCYRSQPCAHYHGNNGVCPYGNRCMFAHNEWNDKGRRLSVFIALGIGLEIRKYDDWHKNWNELL